jgi:hypothetical protein
LVVNLSGLVAELGAAFVCADLRITDAPRADHAQYLASWLAVLKADKRAIFTAASKAMPPRFSPLCRARKWKYVLMRQGFAVARRSLVRRPGPSFFCRIIHHQRTPSQEISC